MDWKLELVVVPVSDQDRAKAFYTEQVGFGVLVDGGVPASDIFHVDAGGQAPGPDPDRATTTLI